MTSANVLSFADVRALLGTPSEMMSKKILDHVDKYAGLFIAHSPFLAMATSNATGQTDCSPRGDYPGFVQVLDSCTLAMPDRPGNKLADSFGNLASNPGVGLLFFVPGVRETLRVNGRAHPTDSPDVLARMEKRPKLAIIVEVEEVFFHCGRALIRSKLWDPASQALAEDLPSAGQIAAGQLKVDIDPELVNQGLEAGYKELY